MSQTSDFELEGGEHAGGEAMMTDAHDDGTCQQADSTTEVADSPSTTTAAVASSPSDEKNLRSFRIPAGTPAKDTTTGNNNGGAATGGSGGSSPPTGGGSNPSSQHHLNKSAAGSHHHPSSVSPTRTSLATNLTQHQLVVRFKAAVKDISALAKANRDESMIDHFLVLAEEAMKEFRGAKSDIRKQHRTPGILTSSRSSNKQHQQQQQVASTSSASTSPSASTEAIPVAPSSSSSSPATATATSVQHQHADPSSTSMAAGEVTPPRRGTSPSAAASLSASTSSAAPAKKPFSYAAALAGKVAAPSNNNATSLPPSPQKQAVTTTTPTTTTPAAATSATDSQPSRSAYHQTPPPPPANIAAASSSPLAPNNNNINSAAEAAAAVARGEERRAEAQGRRKLLAAEKHRKFEEQAERSAMVKVRREQAMERTKTDAQEKAERAFKLRTEATNKKREFPAKDLERVEEVAVLHALTHEVKVAEVESRQKSHDENVEHRKKSEAAIAKERAEAHEAVIDRAREMENARRERQEQKIAQKEEAAKKLDEQRRQGNELKKQRHEDRERRAVEERTRVEAESESKHRESMRKLEESAIRRRDQVEDKNRTRQERAQQLIQQQLVSAAAIDGVDRQQPHQHHSKDAVEDQFTSRLMTVVQRHGKMFLDSFAKQNENVAFNSKCRFNVILEKFSRPTDVLTRQTAAEFTRALTMASSSNNNNNNNNNSSSSSLTEQQDELDHLTLRLHSPNVFEILTASIVDFRKSRDKATDGTLLKAPFDLLHRLLLHPREGPKHLTFFCRSGLFVSLVPLVLQDLRLVGGGAPPQQQQQQGSSDNGGGCSGATVTGPKATILLRDALSIVQLCACFFIAGDDAANPASHPFRLIMGEFLKHCELEQAITSLSQQGTDDCVLEVLQLVLLLFQLRIRSTTSEDETSKHLHMLLTALNSVLMPKGQLVKTFTNVGTMVLFTMYRLVNELTRKNLTVTHRILVEPASRQLVFHALSTFCSYVKEQGEDLESISNPTSEEVRAASFDPGALSPSFLDAVDFGLTFLTASRPPVLGEPCDVRLRCALHEVLLFVGYISLNNPAIQDVFHYGANSSLLIQLLECCPMSYFGVAKHILLPSLVSICFKNRRNLTVLSEEIALDTIQEFLTEEIAARPSAARRQRKADVGVGAAGGNTSPAHGAPAATPRPQPENWADMEDDDDDDETTTTESESVQTPSVDEGALAAARKEKLTLSIATTGNRYAFLHHFRLDKRFPLSLWSDALAELKTLVLSPTPGSE